MNKDKVMSRNWIHLKDGDGRYYFPAEEKDDGYEYSTSLLVCKLADSNSYCLMIYADLENIVAYPKNKRLLYDTYIVIQDGFKTLKTAKTAYMMMRGQFKDK
jgi:hypothetical protein